MADAGRVMVRVWQSCGHGESHDWESLCSEHGHIAISPNWLWAMENAWGHIAMHHTKP